VLAPNVFAWHVSPAMSAGLHPVPAFGLDPVGWLEAAPEVLDLGRVFVTRGAEIPAGADP
jgi:hypothetical protein